MIQFSTISPLFKRAAAVALLLGAAGAPLLSRVAASAAGPLPVGSSGGANLVFSDEFDGTALNSGRWHTCSWWASSTCSIESNAELELYTKNNVSVANGVLKLQARKENAVAWNGKTYNYTSGMVSTGGRSGEIPAGFTFTYGYMEARVKVPAGQGLWPAFWTLPADYSWPPEIDVMEILGNAPNVTEMHYHYNDASGAHQGPGKAWTGPDFSADWHTFGVDWQPGSLVWYVDGVERWRFTSSAVTAKPQYLLLNLAVGGNWPGSPNASTPFPSDYLVDYVRVWDHFGTPGTPSPTTTVAPAPATTVAPAPTTTTVAPAPPPASGSGYAGAVAADGPVSYWRLGETSGATAADSVGSNAGAYRNGVTQGAASLLTSDTSNKAAALDGVNDSVSVASTAALSPATTVTVEAWIRPTAKPAAGSFASVVAKTDSYALQLNGPQLEFTTVQGTTRRRVQAPASAIVAGQAYHVVGIYDGTTQRLFVNGAQVASGAFSGAMNVNTKAVVVGSWDGASEFVAGSVDDVAVYAKALSASQVSTHYSQGAGAAAPAPSTTTTTVAPAPAPAPSGSTYAAAVTADGPVAFWRLGETVGTAAADSVGAAAGAYRNGVTQGATSLTSDTANKAAAFDGVNDSVSVASTAALSPANAVTVEAWIRPTAKPAAGSFASVVSKSESYSLQFNGPQLEFTTIQGSTRRRVQAPASAVVAGQTYHVVGTYDGTTQRLFVNGAQVASGAFSGAINVNASPVVIGSWDSASEFVSATIDDVAIYAKALTAAQVATHYSKR